MLVLLLLNVVGLPSGARCFSFSNDVKRRIALAQAQTLDCRKANEVSMCRVGAYLFVVDDVSLPARFGKEPVM